MSWNYRIVKHANEEESYGLHEVYYDANGVEDAMTVRPIFSGDSPAAVIETLMIASMDAKRRPVFNEPKDWAEYLQAKKIVDRTQD